MRRPAACFEIFEIPNAALVTVSLQILTMLAEIGIYFMLENYGFFTNPSFFRLVIIPIAIVYIGGGILAIFGVLTRKRLLITVHSTITSTLMVLTDILAVSIIFLMAIGKRSDYLHNLHRGFVNEKKFYEILGPFWMYLGAIFLHATVAVNMAFLQPLNDFSKFVEKESEIAKTALQSSYSSTSSSPYSK
ncbi:unnamed protein product [Caenorhabditis angaria]|uniref:Uncharacterized protein n=1 Tax=Caenorhabditis angaria TaxID=860376 RepID=A0A9P1MTA5_9PELO|nr:unnamed protein product [Caenorhabditis angaria]